MFEGKKIGIVGSSGGMRCVEGAGARYRLHELGLSKPDIEVATSGNIPNAMYGLADQDHLGWKIWTEDLPTDPDFIKWDRFGEILSVDVMVDREFTNRRPLNDHAFLDALHTGTEVYFATTHHSSGKTRYFRNEDFDRGVKPLEVVRAGTALVGLTRKRPVKIDGDLYSDGAPSTEFKDSIQVALDAGADYVIAIDSRTDTEREEFLPKFMSSGWAERVALLQPESKALMVTTDQADLRQSFYAGFNAVSKHPLLQELFGGLIPDRRAA